MSRYKGHYAKYKCKYKCTENCEIIHKYSDCIVNTSVLFKLIIQKLFYSIKYQEEF